MTMRAAITRLRAAAQAHRPSAPVEDVLLGTFLVGLIPVERVSSIHQGYGIRAWSLAAIVVVGCAVLVWPLRERRDDLWVTAAVVGAMAAAGAVAGGRIVGLWLLGTGTFGAWVGMRRRYPRLGTFPRHALLPVLVATFLTARRANSHDRLGIALAWFAATVALAVVLRWHPDLPSRAGRWLGRAVHLVVTVVLLVPLWAITALVPWVFQRLTRFDPLAPRGPGTSWVPRAGDAVDSQRLWFSDPARDRLRLGRRAHARAPFALGLLSVVAVAFGIFFVQVIEPLWHPPPRNEAEAILQGAPASGELRRANDEAISRIWFSQWVGNEWSDYASELVNIEDGRRRTWRPDECPDDQLRVWVFGGSTTFGVYQRDDATIPSALAQAADERGLALHVENWGMPGDVAWQQVRRLERALAAGDRPDLVVFYDGWNDLRAVQDLDFAGREGLDADFIGPMDRVQSRALRDLAGAQPGGTYTVEVPESGRTEPDEAVAVSSRSYRSAHEHATLLTEANEVPFVHFYQPSLLTRSEAVPGEPSIDPTSQDAVDAFRARMPRRVVDLGGAFDGESEPMFYDEVHTVDAGSPVVADAMLDELWPVLEELAETEGVGACQ